ncbi:hypothetical protein [Corynebacterium aquilae]|uniref:Uncharacterized protein n=1 Tax=Corynebacterium aquilae DSM 44791 TaxID=1431546 RepID=A0A1L7CGT5_9CORY|nr:hypothetical protein [Corynebacterium aquilae]APT85039.1 hypothetical protein CAQU_08090 [Corynebacterium aquilae DSM 44791]
MPSIIFTALVPTTEFDSLVAQFENLSAAMAAQGRFDSCGVVAAESRARGGEVDKQLRAIYREQHDEMDLEDADVYDITLSPQGYAGSLNELTMWFARLLTPPATLPGEAALRENDELFEVPDTYPWTVSVRP